MAKKWVVLLALLWLGSRGTASAQILNIENFRVKLDTADVWKGSLTFNFNLRRQVVRVTTFQWIMNLSYLSRHNSYQNISNINLLFVNGTRVINDAYLHGRVNIYRQRVLSYETFGQFQFDRARGLEKRALIGAGTRTRLAYRTNFLAHLGNGFMFESEDWRRNPGVTTDASINQFNFLKTTNYFTGQITAGPTLTLNFTAYYQARINKLLAPRVVAEASAVFKLTRYLNLNMRYSALYDAAPVVPIDPWVWQFNNGVVFAF